VARLTYCALLDRARNDCDTSAITRNGGEVAKLVVTARLRSAFAGNLNQLGFSAAPVELKLGLGTVGQHPYHLSLIVPGRRPAFRGTKRGREDLRCTRRLSGRSRNSK
jgi:hypothetical protein